MILGDIECTSDIGYFLATGKNKPVDYKRSENIQPTTDDFDVLNYIESNFDTYFEPSKRYHFYRYRF